MMPSSPCGVCDGIAVDACVMGRGPFMYTCLCYGKESIHVYLLSGDIRNVARLNLEGAIVCPQVYRVCDACDTALKDLGVC
jgi:hypothetical protein